MNIQLQKKLWSIAAKPPLISEFLIVPEWKTPCDIKKYFSGEIQSYCLELGSGWGEVAIRLALENPNIGFVLMEKKKDRIQNTLRKIQQKNLINIRIISVNFNWFLKEIFSPLTFDWIILNFPDPWPKKKHKKNRTISEDFLNLIWSILKPNGKFQFATDYGPYARQVISIFRKMNQKFSFTEEYSFSRKIFPVSKFESMKIREGKRIYYLERTKQ
ncbi:MAG: methyltransferase domain-containing protein [Leptospiraceae bacterium]|nr:methyltransferase domain-containing protein [Leptospiraceae bacterium]NUM42741.1 methyltransferase domain-containing protein [Leptospiraceae bacterium]